MAQYFGNNLILLEKLAAGGMAEVFRAKQLGLDGFEKVVALKRILPHYSQKDEFKTMFRREANLSGLLHHSNIVQVFGNGEYEGYLYLLMEYVNGKNVRQLLASADKLKIKIPVEMCCYIICEAAKGLDYAHQLKDENTDAPLNIIHRDMSPQNIMMSYEGDIKIVDFGIAKVSTTADEEETRAGVLKGKFGYMSPEQAEGAKLDKRTDVFALGIILFELLTQRRLFTSKDDLKTLKLVQECKVPRPSKYNPNVDGSLDQIVLKTLEKDKSLRYQSAHELYEDLQRYLNQKYPKFLPTEFSSYLKKTFSMQIEEEKRKRDKVNQELPHPSKETTKITESTKNPSLEAKSRSGVALVDQASSEVLSKVKKEVIEGAKVEFESLTNQSQSRSVVQGHTPPPPMFKEKTDHSKEISLKDYSKASFKQNDQMIEISAPLVMESSSYSEGIRRLETPRGNVRQHYAPVEFNSKKSNFLSVTFMGILVALFLVGVYQYQDHLMLAWNSFNQSKEVQNTQSALVKKESDHSFREPASMPSDAFVVEEVSVGGYLTLYPVTVADEIQINGKVLYDKNYKKMSTPVLRFKLKPGKYTVELKNTIYQTTWKKEVVIDVDRVSSFENFLLE